AITAAVFWSPRPQMFSFVLSAVVLYVLWRYRNGRGLWLIVPIMVLWGNLHAGYSIGFILLAGAIAGEALNTLTGVEGAVGWRGVGKLILVTAVSAVALLVNPYGADILRVPFETVNIGALQAFIVEWQSPDFHNRQMWPFAAFVLAVLGAAGASQRRFNWTDFLLVAGTAFLSFYAARNIATFAVVATPILTQHLDALLTERGWTFHPVKFVSPRMGLLNAALVVIIGLAALLQVVGGSLPRITRAEYSRSLPVLAAEYINAERPAGPMFNSYNWGGYLMFTLPDYPVFVDGRTDLYGDFLNVYYNTTNGGDGWRETLDEYGINLVVVEAGGGLARNLRVDTGWRLAYEDDLAAVFVREIS
ncbi:MAG: hypothetical protein H7175_01755, partial [Burkholderiales bacterium]|nr:hypothetical protein [Anaerolineae bacterium]